MDDVVLDRLVVGGHIAVCCAIEIALADIERILAERERHLVDHPLRADHALRSAEAAERGVGHGVGVERRRLCQHRRIEIGVVAMEQCAIGDRPRQVGREAAARRVDIVDAKDGAVVVEADFIVDQEVVALAGRRHVVVAVRPDLDRAAEPLGGDRGQRCKLVALRLLAAEAAAHPPDLDRDRMRRHAQRMRDHVLHLARVLRRGIDGDVLVLAGHRHGDLAFEVEMVLAADPHLAF